MRFLLVSQRCCLRQFTRFGPAVATPKSIPVIALCLGLIGFCAATAEAHEAWIQPREFISAESPLIVGHIKVGKMLKGTSQLYNRDTFDRFDVWRKNTATPVKGRLGDLPALKHELGEPGLHTLVYQSRGNLITYENWPKFENFASKEGIPWVLQSHIDRGLPRENFKETYIRYAKALIAWQDASGNDAFTGMRFEIVALDNPYLNPGQALPIRVLLDGEPYRDAQVTIFAKRNGNKTERSTTRTDGGGNASIAVQPDTLYLLNSVFIEPLEAKKNAPVWRSHWASLTFKSAGE